MTKREMFVALKGIDAVSANAELVAFIDHELELLDRKATSPRKPTANQVENEAFKADIVTALTAADKPVSIKELIEICPSIAGLTNQRITHMLTDLRKGGVICRSVVKKVPYYAIGAEEE